MNIKISKQKKKQIDLNMNKIFVYKNRLFVITSVEYEERESFWFKEPQTFIIDMDLEFYDESLAGNYTASESYIKEIIKYSDLYYMRANWIKIKNCIQAFGLELVKKDEKTTDTDIER